MLLFDKYKKNIYIENIISLLCAGIMFFFFSLKSPLHPWVGSDAATDSSVFKTVALMMKKGYMPYKDSFDHKGPLLYIINWIGDCIQSYRGIWIIEFVFMVLTIWIMYKTSRLICNISSSVIVTLLSFSLMFEYFEGGNLTEEYAMVFIAVSLYIFIDYLKNKYVTNCRIIICGLCFGGTLLIRPNMISLWVVMCIAIFIDALVKKQWKELKSFVLFFLIGMFIIVIPIVIWLSSKGALYQCWNDYILFNKEYTSISGDRASISAKWNSFFTFFNTPVFIMALFAQVYSLKKKEKFLNITYLIYMVVTLILICLSGMTYPHYGMILVPLLVYPFAILFGEMLQNPVNENNTNILVAIVSIYLLSSIIVPNWVELIKELPDSYKNRNDKKISEVTDTIVDYIVNNTETDDCISVYGNWDIIYVLSDRRHATRYSYQFPVAQVMPSIMDEYINQLAVEQPKVIVVTSGHWDDNITTFLYEYGYEIAWSQNGESQDGAIICVRQ